MLPAAVFGLLPLAVSGYMQCGTGVPLCGVLTLESGFGHGYYRHSQPTVHGLWPQVGWYGSSRCIRPRTSTAGRDIYSCYRHGDNQHALWFEGHEWSVHGACAGAVDENTFFGQVCALSEFPLELMESQEKGGFQKMVDVLRSHSLPVYYTDVYNDQIQLSACASYDGQWKLTKVDDFESVCASRPQASEESTMRGTCIPMQRGPPCRHDSECADLQGCIRCARSGFCTDVHLGHDETRLSLASVSGMKPPVGVGDAAIAPQGVSSSHLQCPPVEPGQMGICVEECSSGEDCHSGGQMCCSNGCGHVCMEPVDAPKPKKKALMTDGADASHLLGSLPAQDQKNVLESAGIMLIIYFIAGSLIGLGVVCVIPAFRMSWRHHSAEQDIAVYVKI